MPQRNSSKLPVPAGRPKSKELPEHVRGRSRMKSGRTEAEEEIRLILKLGSSLSIAQWEINSLIAMCSSKIPLKQGSQILSEYLRIRQDIFTLLGKRNSYYRKFLSVISEPSPQHLLQLPRHAQKLAEYSLKSWISICRWRQLQWTPRPISVLLDGTESTTRNFHLEFDAQLRIMLSKLKDFQPCLLALGVEPKHLTLYLLTSTAEYLREGSGTLLLQLLDPHNSHSLNQALLLSPYGEVVEIFQQLFSEEISSFNTWTQFHSDSSSDRDYSSPPPSPTAPATTTVTAKSNEIFPVLALKYSDIVPASRTSSANGQNFHLLYSRCTQLLLSCFYQHFAPDKRKGEPNSLYSKAGPHEAVLSLMSALNLDSKPSAKSLPDLIAKHNTLPREPLLGTSHFQFHSQLLSVARSSPPAEDLLSQSESCLESLEDAKSHTMDYHPAHDSCSVASAVTLQSSLINQTHGQSFSRPPLLRDRPVSSGANLAIHSSQSKRQGQTSPKSARLPSIGRPEESSQPLLLFAQVSPASSPRTLLHVSAPLLFGDRLCLKVALLQRQQQQQQQQRSGKQQPSSRRVIIQEIEEPCSPLLKRSCCVGDEIVAINGVRLEGRSLTQVQSTLRTAGAAKSLPQLSLRRFPNTSSPEPKESLPPQISEGLTAVLKDLEQEVSLLERQSGGSPTSHLETLLSLKDSLQKLRSSSPFPASALPVTASVSAFVCRHEGPQRSQGAEATETESAESPPQLITSVGVPVPAPPQEPPPLEHQTNSNTSTSSPNLRSGSLVLRKSILKNLQLQRDGSKDQTEGEQPPEKPKSRPMSPSALTLRSSLIKRRGRRDSDDNSSISRSSFVQFTPSPSRSPAPGTAFSFPDSARSTRSSDGSSLGSVSVSRKYLSKSSLLTLRTALSAVGPLLSKAPNLRAKAAARKLQIWWRLMFPQKKLYHKRWVKALCREWVYELFDRTYERTIQVRRLRRQLMREGGAMKIQRRFRHWRRTVLSNCIRIQRCWRRSLVRSCLRQLVTQVRAGIRVARFLYQRRRKLRQLLGKKQLYRRVLRGFLETIGIRLREKKLREASALAAMRSRRSGNDKAPLLQQQSTGGGRLNSRAARTPLRLNQRDLELSRQRSQAATRIQAMVRRWSARKLVAVLRKEERLFRHLCVTRVVGQLRLWIKRHKVRRMAVIRIASAWRGCCSRWKLMIRLLACYKIRSCWRSYKEYWKLKRCLRRAEVPVTIVFHRLRNIPPSALTSGTLKVRVSVWWSSLLHLVEKKTDFQTVIQSKAPNVIRTTSLFSSEDQLLDLSLPSLGGRGMGLGTQSSSSSFRRARKLTLSEQTQRLLPHESCRKLTETDKLQQFASQHMHRPFRLGSISLASPSASPTASSPIRHGSSFNRPGSSLTPNPQLKIHEEGNEDSASDSASNHSVSEDCPPPLSRGASSSSSSSSSSSESEDDEEKEEEERKAPLPKKPPSHRFSTENIGRDCTNLLGSNLIAESSFETKETSKSALQTAKKLLQASLSLEMGHSSPNTHGSPARVLLRHFSRSEQDSKPATPGPLSNFSGNLINALKPTALISSASANAVSSPEFSRAARLMVDLQDETLYIPGCHGNSVIRFDFYDGDVRKIGSHIYELAEEKTLMFWGGECSPELVLTPIGRKAPTNRAAKGPGLPNGAIFDVRIASGIPRSSRCGWALLCVKGMGPLKSKLRNKDFLKSFFETWESFYLSMDGQALHLFLAKNSATAFHTIPLRSLRRIHVEPALPDPHHLHTRHGHSSASANSKPHTDNAKLSAIEDRYLVVLSTSANDTIQLKFQDRHTRENWVRTIVHGVNRLHSIERELSLSHSLAPGERDRSLS